MNKQQAIEFYQDNANRRSKWKKRNRFYHKALVKYFKFIVPENSRVIELGCGTGELLNALKPSYGVGIDYASAMVDIAREKYPDLYFQVQDAENLDVNEQFDYVIMSDLVGTLWDIQAALQQVQKLCHKNTKLIISSYNYLWQPVMRISEFLRLKMKQPIQNWLSLGDIQNLLYLEKFETIKTERKILFPKYIPLINTLLNKFLANLPGVSQLALINLLTARPQMLANDEYSVSILVPARNEKGNIENAILRTPKFGKWQEFLFVEGNSSDGTYDEMLRVKEKYPDHKIKIMKQSGKGKGNAVREGFEQAAGDILMILDADLTTPPEDMPKFYHALAENRGEFINGCRLVYKMEKQAMRLINFLGNKFFGWFFTYVLGQRLKDTLCGTKVLFKHDYDKIVANRSYFGDFDPFGDFDLLFGASKLNLKMTEVIVRYKDREYGSTQISRFKHGWLLIKMSLFAARKIKFI